MRIRFIVPLSLLLLDGALKMAVMTAHALVPSQVSLPEGVRIRRKRDAAVSAATTLGERADRDDDLEAGDEVVYVPPRRSAPRASRKGGKSSSSSTPRRAGTLPPRTGILPDVRWRAIPMAHLRCHPRFRPLPPPSEIRTLPTREHVRQFRQESWQWDYLHAGRCTTSKTVAALGFLEPRAAAELGVPPTLRKGGAGAYAHLRRPPADDDQSLAAWERTLCEGPSSGRSGGGGGDGNEEATAPWIPAARLRRGARAPPFPFAAKYVPTVTHEQMRQRKREVRERCQEASHLWSTRIGWGNAQEATAILTALNHFCSADKGAAIYEVGMCGASHSHPSLNGLKLGATPDAMILHGNGTVEVLEVKNHCPFAFERMPWNVTAIDQGSPISYRIRDYRLDKCVPTTYIPQLMMEMLCVGDAFDLDGASETKSSEPACRSAIMVRQTATKGAVLLRLQRDDDWIEEMQYWLGEFQTRFVATGRAPPKNFFWDEDPRCRYRRFLQRTKEVSENVELVAYIENKKIQRVVLDRKSGKDTLVPLFLDNIN